MELLKTNSIQKILSKINLSIIDYAFNEKHYGSLMIYFKFGKKTNKIYSKKRSQRKRKY